MLLGPAEQGQRTDLTSPHAVKLISRSSDGGAKATSLACVDELAEKGGIFRRQRNDAIERISQDAEVVSVVGWRTLCPSGSRT